MSDEFDKRDWVEDLNEGIRNRDTWFRGLKIVVLLLFLAIARFALIVAVAYQFCFCLVRNRPSEIMLPIGRWLARYLEQSILFITWNTDHAPFPFTHINRVMEQEPDYRDDETAFHAEDETFAEEEERYGNAPPHTEDEVAGDDSDAAEETGDKDAEDEEDRPSQPPRPDA